jgi:hypothetical protein
LRCRSTDISAERYFDRECEDTGRPDQTARKPPAPDQPAGKLHARSDADDTARPRSAGHEGAHARSEIHHAPRPGQKATTPQALDKRPTKLQRRDRQATIRHRPDQTAMKPQRADPERLTRDDPIKEASCFLVLTCSRPWSSAVRPELREQLRFAPALPFLRRELMALDLESPELSPESGEQVIHYTSMGHPVSTTGSWARLHTNLVTSDSGAHIANGSDPVSSAVRIVFVRRDGETPHLRPFGARSILMCFADRATWGTASFGSSPRASSRSAVRTQGKRHPNRQQPMTPWSHPRSDSPLSRQAEVAQYPDRSRPR